MARKLVVEIVGDASSLEKSYATATRSTKAFGREISHATRGTLSGSSAMRGFGRSLAFASGGFLAFEGASRFLTESITAAREAGVAQRSLAAQMKAAGQSFAANRDQVEKAALSYERFGFQNDEVIQSLTVLERGTGNINAATRLQGLTADIARAKNIDLAAAAGTIAKVFGGQETALRRAVPGLAKNAHGWDLIRLAQAKMAGQAAANTTVSERFAATLHDTQEIVGTALLPILNKYLGSLSNWLEKMNRSGQLQKQVASTARVLAAAVNAVKAVVDPLVVAFQALASAVGGNKRAFEVLLGVWASYKSLKIAGGILETMTALRRTSIEGQGLLRVVSRLRVGLLRLVANPYTVAIVLTYIGAKAVADRIKKLQQSVIDAQAQTFKRNDPLETVLVPRLAKQIEAMKKAGVATRDILARLRRQMGGSVKGDDLIAEAFSFSSGNDAAMIARIRRNVRLAAEGVKKVATDEITKVMKGPTVEQRNTWFDALIGRQLDRVQDLPLRRQLARLREIAGDIRARMADTKDVTRRLTLQDRLVEILRQERDIQGQIADAVKAGNQALRDRADAIKSATLAALDQRHQAVQNRQQLQDALDRLRTARALGGPQGIKLAQRDVSEARFTITRAQLEGATARLTRGPGGTQRFTLGSTIHITINGATDPEQVARKVAEIIKRHNRHTSIQSRGPAAGVGY